MDPAAPEHPYDRKIVEHTNNLLIETRCVLCGFRIVGSASAALQQDEMEHAERCPKKKPKSIRPKKAPGRATGNLADKASQVAGRRIFPLK